MLQTKLLQFESDIKEVINLFSVGEQLNIRHDYKESEISKNKIKVVNTIVVGGKCYSFGNLISFCNDIDKKRLIKRFSKLSVYKALASFTGESQPWGALTGIRPTKLAYSQIEADGEFEDFFINTMQVSKEKTSITKEVIDGQNGYYIKGDSLLQNSLADFFVFIPFCPTRCKYCSFITSDVRFSAQWMDEYTRLLCKEIEESAKINRKFRSIYIGGGTPLSLSEQNLIKVLSAIDKLNAGVEYTVEAGRPDVINKEKLNILKDFGVTRICVNPQTFCDKTLKLIGRNHTAQEVIDKYLLAKDDFIINMDLIAGLDGETFSDFEYSLNKTISLFPDNITVHTLCIKKGSALSQEVSKIDKGEIERMVDFSYKSLKNAGYMPYYLYRQKYMAGNLENIGWTKPKKACLYNIDTMEDSLSIVACGANAISKRLYNKGEKIERLASPKDIKTYINKIDNIISQKKEFFA